MTEFGSCDETGWLSECSQVMDFADAHLQSWCEWSGTPQTQDFIDVLSRTYVHATAGTPLNMTFNTDTKRFDFCYKIDTSISAPTEIIAVFATMYPNGTKTQVTNSVMPTIDIPTNRVYLSPTPATINGAVTCFSLEQPSV